MKLFKRLAMLAASLSDRCGIATQYLPLASSRFLPRRLTDLPQAKLRASSHESGVVAKGFEVIDLASGASSADTPAVLKDAAIAAINAGHNQYGQANGDLELRQLYAQRLAKSTGVAIDAQSEVTVVGGTSSALACVLLATIDAGDEVIVFAPYFEGYLQAIAVAQGVARPVALANQPSVGFAALPGA
ncbi:MAG: aminotransferase class I/II-fold pyridoxal phosphate-dependent enzyme [Candidatus Obscuribacter sp.]|nr:aminotransferase class I/II-fold pyridoxal phosphate-dependent enzyme [Candidatus Obscuribacter sp.]